MPAVRGWIKTRRLDADSRRHRHPGDLDELHAVYLGQGGHLPIRIRVFLEFLAERIKIGDDPPTKDV